MIIIARSYLVLVEAVKAEGMFDERDILNDRSLANSLRLLLYLNFLARLKNVRPLSVYDWRRSTGFTST